MNVLITRFQRAAEIFTGAGSADLFKYQSMLADVAVSSSRLQSLSTGNGAAFLETAAATGTQQIPESYDFFTKHPKCKKEVRFQGMCGSCVTYAMSSAATYRTCQHTQGASNEMLSVPYILGCGADEATTNLTYPALCANPVTFFTVFKQLQQVMRHMPVYLETN